MFSVILRSVEKYTAPVVYSMRRFDGRITSGIATFVVVNEDGWIVTAAHVITSLRQAELDSTEMQARNKQIAQIQADTNLSEKVRRKRIGETKKNNDWITNQAVRWGNFDAELTEILMDTDADLAVGRLKPFDPKWVGGEFPTLMHPKNRMLTGSSLCRLGFPFVDIRARFHEDSGLFELDPSCLPVPPFPNDGIFTRGFVERKGGRVVKIVETSTPGLRGQSGGPIFDRHGRIWAIQSRTHHLALGFSPTIKVENKDIVEHQFMHVGWGAHIEGAIALLDSAQASYKLSSEDD